MAATPEVTLHLGDVVTVVGQAEELEKLCLLLGEETPAPAETRTKVVPMDVDVTKEPWPASA